MMSSKAKWCRRLATRGVIAALPAAMVIAYAGDLFVPTPPRLASYRYVETAEIVDSSSAVGVADSNLYGMTDEEIAAELDRLQSLGVQDIRVFVPWGLVEYADDTYNWSYIDSIMAAAEERNMGVMMEVNATPTWAAEDPESGNVPVGSATPNVDDFTDFMTTLATRYGDTVSAYEIWNEPNYVGFSNPIDPEAYAELLKSVYPVLKEIDPTATVVAGALGTVQDTSLTMSAVTFVEQMLEAGAGDYFDAISVHPYQDSLLFSDGYSCDCGGQLTPLQQIDAIKELIGADKTVWITEYGVSTVNGAEDEAKQAQYIQDLLDYWQTYSQAGPVFIYTGSDTATGSSDTEANYGLFYESGDPKQAAEMLAAWIAEHATGSTDPTDPTDPTDTTGETNQLLQAIQTLVNAITGTISQAVNAVSVFAQAIITAISNVVTSLTSALTSIGSTSTETTAAAVTASSRLATVTEATDAATSTHAGAVTELGAAGSEESTSATNDAAPTVTDDTTSARSATVAASSVDSEAPASSTTEAAETASVSAESAPAEPAETASASAGAASAEPAAATNFAKPNRGSGFEPGTTSTDHPRGGAGTAGPNAGETSTVSGAPSTAHSFEGTRRGLAHRPPSSDPSETTTDESGAAVTKQEERRTETSSSSENHVSDDAA